MASVRLAGIGVTFRIYDAGLRSFKRRLVTFGHDTSGLLEIEALSGLDLDLGPGKRVGLLGANSVGKTTLLRVVAGLLRPGAGTVGIEGKPGAVFNMGFGIDPEASLTDLVYAQGLLMGISPSKARGKVPEILEFGEIEDHANYPANVVPTGILQRAAIASMLVLGADIILLDEVLEHLDPAFCAKCERALRDLTDRGGISIVVERSRQLLPAFCDEVLIMGEGRILSRGATAAVLAEAGAAFTF